MFKIAKSSLAEVKDVMRQIYEEAPQHWPNGLGIEWFDGGVWAVKEAQTGKVAGFVGWQVRFERAPGTRAFQKVGYYSVGILPEHRRNGFAKEALMKLIAMKSATCDKVRAMISASNKPSQALADVLGVEKMIKGASLLKSIAPLLQRAGLKGGAPILGEEMGASARSQGLNLLYPRNWFGDKKITMPFKGYSKGEKSVTEAMSDVLPTRIFPRIHEVGKVAPKGPTYSPTSIEVPRGAMAAKAPHFEDDKLMEAEAFGKYMPKTISLSDVVRRAPRTPADLAALKSKLQGRLGPNWILKHQLGEASAPGSLLTEASPLDAWKGVDPGFTIAQMREPVRQNSGVLKSIDDWLDKKTRGAYSNLNRGQHELRVHALNGQVVPYATIDRGSILRSLTAPFMPARSPTMRRAENYVQEALNQNPKMHQGAAYGFDVGIRPDGTPFIIESNPSVGGRMSGFFSSPFVADAMSSSIKGELPSYVKARRALYGTGLVGGAAALNQQQAPPPKPLSIMDRFNLARRQMMGG